MDDGRNHRSSTTTPRRTHRPVRKLSERQHAALAAQKAAEEATREASAAWSEATQAGWTSTELRKLGLAQPTNRRGGRPKGSRTTKKVQQTAAEDQDASDQ